MGPPHDPTPRGECGSGRHGDHFRTRGQVRQQGGSGGPRVHRQDVAEGRGHHRGRPLGLVARQERPQRHVVRPEPHVVLTVGGGRVVPAQRHQGGVLVGRHREVRPDQLGADAVPAQEVLDAHQAHPGGDDLVLRGDEAPEPRLAQPDRAGAALGAGHGDRRALGEAGTASASEAVHVAHATASGSRRALGCCSATAQTFAAAAALSWPICHRMPASMNASMSPSKTAEVLPTS